MIEFNINKRWEEGIPHHPKSWELAKAIGVLDAKYGGDYLDLQFGGDGDNGEHLAYLLDIHFEMLDAVKQEMCPDCGEVYYSKGPLYVCACK